MRISVFNWGENRYFKKKRECIMLNYRCWFGFLKIWFMCVEFFVLLYNGYDYYLII